MRLPHLAAVSLLVCGCASRAVAPQQPEDPPTAPAPVANEEPRDAVAVTAAMEAALKQWASSCPSSPPYGGCVRFRPAAEDGASCWAPALGDVRVQKRDERALDALMKLDQLTARANTLADPSDEVARAEFHRVLAQARLAKFDARIEDLLRVELPSAWPFEVDDWKRDAGHARLEDEYKQQVDGRAELSKVLTHAAADMAELLADLELSLRGSPPGFEAQLWIRRVWVVTHVLDLAGTINVPEGLEIKSKHRTPHCRNVHARTQPHYKLAKQAAQHCVEMATPDQQRLADECRRLTERLHARLHATPPSPTRDAHGSSNTRAPDPAQEELERAVGRALRGGGVVGTTERTD